MDQVSLKKPTSSIGRPSKIYPNLDFWFGNKPSGNPDKQPRVKISLAWIEARSQKAKRFFFAELSWQYVVVTCRNSI
jgi:hypothetical protein